MTKVLFVDDEDMVLKGIRRMLFASDGDWNASFAGNGEHALELMAKESFDVVVSDMRMPGMNGNELLSKVQELYPSTARIILSGHADRSLILESTRHAHQYISKPCDAIVLKSTIDRCFHVRSMLKDDALLRVVSSLRAIPSLPQIYNEIQELVTGDAWTLQDVGDVISRDVGMTAKVLQLVNSSFFGPRRHISNTADAASYLGIDTIKSLVLSVEVFAQFNMEHVATWDTDRFTRHSMNTGLLARLIAKTEGASDLVIDHSFLAGSLHDAGRLLLAMNMPDEYAQSIELSQTNNIKQWEAEQQTIGSTHAHVAAYLLSLWALPQPIVEAVAHHHTPSECPNDTFTPLTAVHVANALDRMFDGNLDEEMPGIDKAYLESIGMLGHLPIWFEACRCSASKEAA